MKQRFCIIAGTGMETLAEDFQYQNSSKIRSDTPWGQVPIKHISHENVEIFLKFLNVLSLLFRNGHSTGKTPRMSRMPQTPRTLNVKNGSSIKFGIGQQGQSKPELIRHGPAAVINTATGLLALASKWPRWDARSVNNPPAPWAKACWTWLAVPSDPSRRSLSGVRTSRRGTLSRGT